MSDDKIDYIQERVDTVVDRVHDMSVTLSTHVNAFVAHTQQDEKMWLEMKRTNDILQDNTASLKDHMRRTELLERHIQTVEHKFSPLLAEQIGKEAVNNFVKNKLELAKKVGGVAGASATIAALVKTLIHFFGK
jgi:CMP-N-acetylneuraminic acid synthetase